MHRSLNCYNRFIQIYTIEYGWMNEWTGLTDGRMKRQVDQAEGRMDIYLRRPTQICA